MAKTANYPILRSEVTVINEWGLHARPSASIATLATKYDCEILLIKQNLTASAKSVASMLKLAASQGTKLQITAQGPNAQQALNEIEANIACGFGEQHLVIKGIGNSCGVVVGKAHVVLNREQSKIPYCQIAKPMIVTEQKRLQKAIAITKRQIKNITHDDARITKNTASFQNLFIAMLAEDYFLKHPQKIIEEKQINAEWALWTSISPLLESLQDDNDEFIKSRIQEYELLMFRIIKQLEIEPHRTSRRGSDAIQLSDKLGPVEVIEARRDKFTAIVSAGGSVTSHAMIISRSIKIPAVLGIGVAHLNKIKEGDLLVVDSDNGVLHLNLDNETLRNFRAEAKRQVDRRKQPTKSFKDASRFTVTRDGEKMYLLANLEFAAEAPLAIKQGAEGVGLMRSEFLFIGKAQAESPSEEEQFAEYRQLIESMEDRPVTIRTLDLGYDKQIESLTKLSSPMGLRGIRESLYDTNTFKTQLRALLRAAKYGNLRILLPMVSNPQEIIYSRTLIAEAQAELGMTGEPLPPIGAMIEIPGSVFLINQLAKTADFFAIGSNDLTQYTLAVDRSDEKLNKLNNPCHPAVIWLLKQTIKKVLKTGKPLTICGEIAGDLRFIKLLATCGLRSFSMVYNRIQPVREELRTINLRKIARNTEPIFSATDPNLIEDLMNKLG